MSLRLSLSSRISCKSCSMKDILLCCSSAADFSFWIFEPSVGLSTLPRIVLRRRAVSSKIRSKRSSGTFPSGSRKTRRRGEDAVERRRKKPRWRHQEFWKIVVCGRQSFISDYKRWISRDGLITVNFSHYPLNKHRGVQVAQSIKQECV